MKTHPMHCNASRDPWDPARGIRLVIGGRLPDGRFLRMATPEFIVYENDDDYFEKKGDTHSLTIAPETAQELIDQLWNLGIRPTEGHGSAGQLAATERHLEDLRSLVFKTVPPRGAKS